MTLQEVKTPSNDAYYTKKLKKSNSTPACLCIKDNGFSALRQSRLL